MGGSPNSLLAQRSCPGDNGHSRRTHLSVPGAGAACQRARPSGPPRSLTPRRRAGEGSGPPRGGPGLTLDCPPGVGSQPEPESAHSLSLGGAHRQGTCPCPQMESKLPLPWAPLAVLFTCPAGRGSPRQVQTGVQGGLGSEGETPVSWVIRQVRDVLPSVLRTARAAPAGLTLLDTCPVASPRSTALTPRAALGRPRGPWAWSPGPVPSPQPEPIPFVRLAPPPLPTLGRTLAPVGQVSPGAGRTPKAPLRLLQGLSTLPTPPSCGPHPQGTSPPCAKTSQVTSGAPPPGRPPLSPPPPAQRALSLLSLFH